MSRLNVNEIVGAGGTGPVAFLNGITGDGTRLSLKPQILSFSPPFTSTNVGISTNISIAFSQPIQFSGSGTIELRSGSATGTVVESYICGSSARLSIVGGNVLTIDPTNNLDYNTLYFITLPSVGIANTFGAFYEGSNNYQFRTELNTFNATGGTYQYVRVDPVSPTGYYKYHIFLNTGSLTVTSPSLNAINFSALLVAGGGGGNGVSPGSYGGGGGGGAGGVLSFTGPTLALPGPATYTISVGGGGNGWNPPASQPTASNGSDTRILTSPTTAFITAFGGGRGGGAFPYFNSPASDLSGFPGGSGGGAGGGPNNPIGNPGYAGLQFTAGSGTPGQGNNGGRGVNMYSTNGYWSGSGGGGGGSGGTGSNGSWPGATYPYPVPTPSALTYAGAGGPGTPVPSFAPPIFSGYVPEDFPSDSRTRSGPTGLFGGGGGGGAGVPQYGPHNASSANGGPGGGGHGTYVNPSYPNGVTPVTGSQYRSQDGARYLGGGGGGSSGPAPTAPGAVAGNGGSGVAMFRYAVPSIDS